MKIRNQLVVKCIEAMEAIGLIRVVREENDDSVIRVTCPKCGSMCEQVWIVVGVSTKTGEEIKRGGYICNCKPVLKGTI